MIKGNNTTASLIAFFLSKFNEKALSYLNFSTLTMAFSQLAEAINAKPNYIRLRRDEFDVFFSNNPRKGWHNRKPTASVVYLFNKFDDLSFEELGLKIKELLELKQNQAFFIEKEEIAEYSEKDVEDIINFEDVVSAMRIMNRETKQRLLNYSIIPRLKRLYNNMCQICGKNHYDIFGVHIIEGHHIDYFVKSLNNDSSNIIILCPDHHRLMHKAKPKFSREQKVFFYPNGYKEELLINYHL